MISFSESLVCFYFYQCCLCFDEELSVTESDFSRAKHNLDNKILISANYSFIVIQIADVST